MKPFYYKFFFSALFTLCSYNIFSQQILTDAVKKKELVDFAEKLNSTYDINRKVAFELAKQKGWATFSVSSNGTIRSLQGVDVLGFPTYLTTYNNIIAAATTRTNTVQPGGSLGLNLSGSSSFMANKLAIWDGGSVFSNHQEFAGKTITLKDNASVVDHSTHVAGTMIAKGAYAPARGMAFGATTLLSYEFNNDAVKMALAAPNLLVSNHSYGYVAGWNYNDTQSRWEWYGLPGDTEDYKFGFYGTDAQAYDHIAYNAPKYLIVEAAGNNRGETGPLVGDTYYGYNSRTDQTMVNKGPRPGNISSNNGYDIISLTANAKNILTVGAVNPLPNGPLSAGDVKIASFSSWGPTDDGRIKPDICGDGVNVLSAGVTAPDAYITLSGTSMATPNVSASVFLLQEYYAQKNSGNFMLSSTLKGLVCHTALDAGNPGPDYIYGWGLLDMSKAAQAITDNGLKSIVTEKNITQGQIQTYGVTASGNGPLVATIAWTDPEGTTTLDGTINDRTPKLVNDLDIRVSDGTTTFKPWVLDPNNPSAAAVNGDNIRDNIEQVYIPTAAPGVNYTITVSHKGILKNNGQAYSLIVTGIGGAVYCASGPLSSADSRINNVTFSDINNTPPTGCTTYSNYTNLTATLELGKTYPMSITASTCGANFNKIAKVYIDWNGNGSFNDAGELVATSSVINATGSFTANVTIPTNVIPGNYSLMRVVLSETNDPNTITSCGSYGKGETQDYRVKFVNASIDAGVTAINSPAVSGTCPSANGSISIHIKNFGTSTLSNIPVNVTINSSAGTVTFSEIYSGTLPPLAEDDFLLSNTFSAIAGTTYTITAATALPTDPVVGNNPTSIVAAISTSPVPINLLAFYCNDAQLYNLTGTGDGLLFWYKNINDAIPFAFGSSIVTAQTPSNNNYYAGLNNFSGNVGLTTKNIFSGGGYNQFTPSVTVTTKVPVTIQSARLYVGNSGKILFTVSNAKNGQVVSSTTINVIATRATPLPGAQPDDPGDIGKVYNLNLSLPAAGTYNISISYPDNATIYRNNAGVTGYPFTLGGIFSIDGNSNSSSFYYYLYDVHVQSLGCASSARVAVALTKPIITQAGINLTSNFSSGNQWYLNDIAIPGATNQPYIPLQSGIYRVDVSSVSGCVSRSDNYSFVLPAKDGGDGAEISLGIFPVPTSGQLNIAFNALKDEQVTFLFVNTLGENVYQDIRQLTAGPFNAILNLSAFSSGIYFMHITVGNKSYVRKISIIK